MMIALDHYVTHQETDALYQFAREMLSDYQGHAATVQRQEAGLLDLKPADIQQVLAVKLHQARQLGVDIQLEVEGPMTLQVTDHLGMIRVLGILLDNATEAASQCDAGRVRLALIQWADQQVVVIMNTYAGDLDLTKILFQADYTTKGPGHGQGLVNVHQLLINSPWELVTSVEGHWFKQELIRTMDQKGGR